MGRLSVRKHRLTIESLDPGSELEGRPEAWSEFAKAFGEITPLTGTEYQLAQQMQSSVTHRIRTEFVQSVTPRMRLKYGERCFNVQSVVNVEERNRELEWMCTEAV